MRRHARRPKSRGWYSAAASSLIVLLAVASSATAAAGAPLTRQGPTATASGGPGGNGTVAAKTSHNVKAAFVHAAASSTATGDLSTVTSQVLHGGYTAAGIGMRNLGYGTISITGVPAGATVKSATLLWDILADSSDPTFAQGTLDGQPVTGTQWASGNSPCWPTSSNFSYEADVTSLVQGNGSYALDGFASGDTNGQDPWTVGSDPPLLEGASLVVIYQLASLPEVTVQIAEGATETDSGNSATATLNGFTVGQKPSLTTTYIVADGQEAGNTASFDGTTLPGVGFPGADPQAVPNYSQGNLWDTVTADVSSYASSGDTSASATVTGNADCLVWVGQVLSVVTSGTVLGFGDSVAAGYGLGNSQGNPDNPGAYPAILAADLGDSVQNFAWEGACASSTEPGCIAQSVNWQIGQVPDDVTPSLITLTVGADDINFGSCFVDIFLLGDLYLRSPSDPCSRTKLDQSLSLFQTALASDLSTIKAKYPGVPILVMNYYNPLPPPPGANHAVCALSDFPTLLYELSQLDQSTQQGLLATLDDVLLTPGRFADDVRTVQGQIYNDAQAVITKLNAAIDTVAAAAGATTVATDFSGHDICAEGSEWVFSPDATASLSLQILTIHKTEQLTWGGDEVCPDPIPSSHELNFRFSRTSTTRWFSASISIAVGTNCVPHPNHAGQTAIAGDFKQASG
jgi:lysophospholipase L1-like esterase